MELWFGAPVMCCGAAVLWCVGFGAAVLWCVGFGAAVLCRGAAVLWCVDFGAAVLWCFGFGFGLDLCSVLIFAQLGLVLVLVLLGGCWCGPFAVKLCPAGFWVATGFCCQP
ncbi:hypothetical protein U1Q18_037159 [Sarracenia purpurea var. burkii]